MDVLSVAAEVYPLIKTGGLADVAGALPGALAPHGVAMRTLLPGYPAVLGSLEDGTVVAEMGDCFGGPARLLLGRAAGLELIALDAPHLYDRPGNPYLGPDGKDWPDNWRRFAALSFAAYELGRGLVEGYRPQIAHCHDWQAALTPAYVAFNAPTRVRTVMTVHNISFQGHFGWDIFGDLRLDYRAAAEGAIEYYGGIGYLKAGLQCADAVTTVSPTYAQELRTAEFGMGLEGLLQSRADVLHGILNGIDVAAWDPARDPALAQTYSAETLPLRAVNRAALCGRFGLDDGPRPLFAVVSRLTRQKGMDMLVECIDGLVEMGGRLCVLGSGEEALEDGLGAAAARHPGRVGFIRGYDEALAHLIQGGADVILVPSRFEPCGLTQLYGLRYGCVPLVSRVGGLADTVIDANVAALDAGVATGIVFAPATTAALLDAVRRAVDLYARPGLWLKMQRRGMKSDVSWDASAEKYAALYADLLGVKRHDDQDR
ncbi:glycogen synthase GlgA [Devosia sp.]|uniref:glycogen synthase GlgA n=1 Tax=Devosia sp. TaxID=1871048 RepID=UPI002F21D4FB